MDFKQMRFRGSSERAEDDDAILTPVASPSLVPSPTRGAGSILPAATVFDGSERGYLDGICENGDDKDDLNSPAPVLGHQMSLKDHLTNCQHHLTNFQHHLTNFIQREDSQRFLQQRGRHLIVVLGVVVFIFILTPMASVGEPARIRRCFESLEELTTAVDLYLEWKHHDTSEEVFMRAVGSIYGDEIGSWCVSRLTTLNGVFSAGRNHLCASFSADDIGSWDVSNVEDMSSLFQGCEYFNADISKWNTGKVKSFRRMFTGAMSFNQPIGNWDTRNVEDMSSCFKGATAFNQDLEHWNLASVTTIHSMFQNAQNFNRPLESWDVSNVDDYGYAFASTAKFDQSLNRWNVNGAITMKGMFDAARSFNQPLDEWTPTGVTDVSSMFALASNFSQDLCTWGYVLSFSAGVESMFRETNCPVKEAPDLSSSPPGPFCFECT